MTLGDPSGAFGGSHGDQSGSESRMSTLIVPLNGCAPIPIPLRLENSSLAQVYRDRRPPIAPRHRALLGGAQRPIAATAAARSSFAIRQTHQLTSMARASAA